MRSIMRLSCLSVTFAFVATGYASQFGLLGETNVVAAGDIDVPENTLLTTTYNGPATIMTQFELDGVLRSVIPETFASEAQFLIGNLTRGYAFFFETNNIEEEFDTINFNGVQGDTFFFVQPGDEFAFLAADDFDDGPGADAVWDTLSLNFNDSRPIQDIGAFEPGLVSVDGSSAAFETSFGLYDAAGLLVEEGVLGDDTPLEIELAPGPYYLVVAGEGSSFSDFVATTSPFDAHVGADPFDITFDDVVVASGSLGGLGPNAIFSFAVTPEPATAMLLLGGVAFLRRRLR
ncbi:MAG TPA: hypothetical protein P5081_10520 [Phycisphaerae bacterium]|nr:hypothetical protein [Phycisphaerae bacterium]HRW53311.1 hypothetical protein [Phycisphaerae bacterium]